MSFRATSAFRARPRLSSLSTPRLALPPVEEPGPSARLRLYAVLAAMAVLGIALGICWMTLGVLRALGVIR